ncbi:MAG: aldehyde dehydrogenase family protein [Armatimonadetes bacterium]|nr:aldehyde dehydrogenase family protein [Armatimonadota bacterium]
MQSIEAKNFINGEWREAASGERLSSLNPADTTEIVGTVPDSDERDVDEAVKAARSAFRGWYELGWVRRAEVLDKFAQLMKRDLEEMARLVTRECGKPLNEGRADVVEALHMAQYAASLGRMPVGEVIASEIPEKDAYIRRKPKGVVGCITPWNFPVAIPLWEMTPSLVSGNTVVFKPSEETPICGDFIFRLLEEAGMPRGVVNIVHGIGEKAGAALSEHPDVDVILFTGSYEVGKLIQRQAATEVHKFVATEMGGKNAVIVLDDADMGIAVPSCVISAFKTAGQRCVSSNRLIVDRKVVDEFQERFLRATDRINVGNGLTDDVFYGPMINKAGVEKYHLHNRKAKEEGADVLREGGELEGLEYAHGYFVKPFVYRMEYRPGTFCLREEAFSPHVAIIPVDGVEEAVAVHNDTDLGLAMAVCTEDFRKMRYVRDHADYGIGYVNLPSIGAEVHLPFGGVKGSGNGHPSAEGLLDAVTHRTAFTVNHGKEIVMAQGMSAEV